MDKDELAPLDRAAPQPTEADIRAGGDLIGLSWEAWLACEGPLRTAVKEIARRIAAEREAVVVGITGEMPGSNGGFSMAVFKADDVPIGTKLYAHPPKEPNT